MTRTFRKNVRLVSGVVLILLLVATGAIAQPTDDEEKEFDDFNFDDIPVEEADLDYIGFGGGYLGMLSLVNYDELNSIAAEFDITEKFSGPMLLNGGGGFIGGVGIDNVRWGVYGVGGTKEVTNSGVDDRSSRTIRFNSGLVALQLDYAIFTPVDGLMIFPGLMIGRASNEIEVHQTRNGAVPFASLFNPTRFNNPSSASDSLFQYVRISRNPLHLQPEVNIEYALNTFLLARVGAGYGLNFGGIWTDPSGTEITGVPDIEADGLNVHLGLFIGLFQN